MQKLILPPTVMQGPKPRNVSKPPFPSPLAPTLFRGGETEALVLHRIKEIIFLDFLLLLKNRNTGITDLIRRVKNITNINIIMFLKAIFVFKCL